MQSHVCGCLPLCNSCSYVKPGTDDLQELHITVVVNRKGSLRIYPLVIICYYNIAMENCPHFNLNFHDVK